MSASHYYVSPAHAAATHRVIYLESALSPDAVAHVHGGAAHGEANVTVWSKSQAGHQANLRWHLEAAGDGSYFVCSEIDHHFVLHQHGGNHDNGGRITLWDRRSHGHQGNLRVWFDHRGGEWYSLRFGHSGKCAHVHGGTTGNDTPLTQWEWVDQANLKWRLAPVNVGLTPAEAAHGHNVVYLESALSPDAVAHVHGGAAHGEANVTVWSKAAAGHQANLRWTLVPVHGHHGVYHVCSAIDPHFVLHQHGGNHDNGGRITLWDRRSHGHQGNLQVAFDHRGGDFYSLRFVHSGKCVHVHGGTTGNDTPITQWEWVDQANLKWRIVAASPF